MNGSTCQDIKVLPKLVCRGRINCRMVVQLRHGTVLQFKLHETKLIASRVLMCFCIYAMSTSFWLCRIPGTEYILVH